MPDLKVGIDGRRAQTGAETVKRSLFGIRKAAGQTAVAADRTTKAFDRQRKSAFSLGRVLKVLAASFVLRELGRLTNTFQEINNRLRLVTKSGKQLEKVQQTIFDIAQKNRIGFASTAELFQRVARSSETLGLSLDDVAQVTDTVSKAITLSGVAAASANAAIVQLGQAMASGTLRGDELRSILEQTPRLARAIADGLGVPIGKLRELGAAGKLSSVAVIQALQSQASVLEAEFEKTIPTISQAFTVLQNSLIRTVGIFAESTGAAGGFADILLGLATFVQGPLLQGMLQFGDVLGVTFDEFGAIIRRTTEGFTGLGINVGEIAGDIGRAMLRIPLTIANFINRAIVEIVNGLAILKTRVFRFFSEVKTGFLNFQNALVGTLATIIGDDEVAEQAAARRVEIAGESAAEQIRLERELAGQLATLEADRTALVEAQIAQEKRLEDAIRQRAEARLAALNEDTSQRGAGTQGEVTIDPKLLTQIQKTIEATRTPLETYKAAVAALVEQWNTGKLPAENFVRALEAANASYIKADNDLTGLTDDLALAGQLFDDTRTPLETYNMALDDYNRLLERGVINQDLFDRSVAEAKKTLDEAGNSMTEFAVQAARNIQSAFANFLFDPFSDGLKGLARSFGETLRRMASELLSQQILKSFFSALGGGGGNIFSTIAGSFQGGGDFQGGKPILVGEGGPEIITPRQSGTVIPNGATQAAPQVTVMPAPVVVLDDPKKVEQALQSANGQRALVTAIGEKSSSVNQALNGGRNN